MGLTQTLDKDFKVKNGLQVAGGATFGGPVTAVTPTNPNHLATKQYVDSVATGTSGGISVGPTEPESLTNGTQWFDTSVKRLKIYFNNEWFTLATSDDALSVTEHTHDPITGFISGFYIYGGDPSDDNLAIIDAGSPYTSYWVQTLDGGFVENLFDSGTPSNDSAFFADGLGPDAQTWSYLLDGNGP